ncbi:type III pantothenate kinase [Aestuariispira ectoiniformans]|uniref:type III pantothenate kinase n=1 Tax=Aestuariispira ectoiniformans TaxID=2775080 RepID=UPI00223C32A6|nr:type III pantothenate kinase [Aestuariispira ectoiniformans]
MLLVIDSGNTNVVFAVYDDGKRLGVWRCANDPKRTADEYAVWLTHLVEHKNIKLSDVTSTVLASVVPETQFNLESLCRRYFGGEPLVVGKPGVNLGMKVLLEHPEQAGADRLVNAVAAHVKYGGPLIIIDFGTATTFDVVDWDGNYAGGVIAPGINLSVQALYMAAAKLPLVEIKPTQNVIGKDTVSAMQSGIFWGYVSMIEGMVTRIKREFGTEEMKVIGTGGLSELFSGYTAVLENTDRGLTLDGLVEIHRRNKGK